MCGTVFEARDRIIITILPFELHHGSFGSSPRGADTRILVRPHLPHPPELPSPPPSIMLFAVHLYSLPAAISLYVSSRVLQAVAPAPPDLTLHNTTQHNTSLIPSPWCLHFIATLTVDIRIGMKPTTFVDHISL